MHSIALLLAVLPQGSAPPQAVSSLTPETRTIEVHAQLDARPLALGEGSSFRVELSLPGKARIAGGGLPEALLQIDCPASIELEGPYYDTFEEQAAHEHLILPYERLFDGGTCEVRFKRIAEPAAHETIGLNVVGYADPEGDAPAFFFRRRIELPVEAGAESTPGDATRSSWGRDDALLQIGDAVPELEVPMLEGGVFDLAEVIGAQPVLLTTYRAFW